MDEAPQFHSMPDTIFLLSSSAKSLKILGSLSKPFFLAGNIPPGLNAMGTYSVGREIPEEKFGEA
jgi:hypothetical protein